VELPEWLQTIAKESWLKAAAGMVKKKQAAAAYDRQFGPVNERNSI
jgi:hypothetical protein